MATVETKLSMKLLIDTKANKVLFAEVDKDCVDFLFHLLSLSVGTLIRLLKDKGMYGCLPNLYGSVENLHVTYIQWKEIILEPKSSVRISSVPLPLLLNDVTTLYKCSSNCFYTTDVHNSVICPNCGRYMSSKLSYVAPPVVKGAEVAKGGFLKDTVYMVMDDLVVKPMSAVSSITGLNKYFNVKDVSVLQEEVVQFGKEEALKLLKASFESKAVLTSVFLSPIKTEK
ncbi:uncharacterized protein LOC132624862 [Lycium barbarum]|uniref:uncharacterized protein LOC132624862 n=1 Tax=Lycium barbarum TaxID=112863 RepID=UPI00293EADD4|nr:uncharacterized protein LOC132624862 [Lycium barbarum]